MQASQLRDLTRKYATGGIGREEYLAERDRLIDGIVNGSIEIRYHNVGPAEAVSAQPVSPHRHWRYLAGSLALVGLLLAALLVYFLDDDATPPAQPLTATAAKPDPGSDLLNAFMTAGDWSESSLQQLESHWNALSPFQQEAARRGIFFRRLKHETAQRIREQEALVAAGQMDALLVAARLRDFAAALNLQSDQ